LFSKQTADIATVKVNLIELSIAGRGGFVKVGIVIVSLQAATLVLPCTTRRAGVAAKQSIADIKIDNLHQLL